MPKPPKKNRPPRKKEKKEFEEVVLQVARVTRVVKGGRRLRFRAAVAIGDRKGRVGLGVGKAGEVSTAIQKAVQKAKKDLLHVPIVNETIPHEVKLRYKSAEILIMPAPLGKGVIAGGAARTILELAGYKNVLGKRFGTTNMLVNAQATIEALRQLGLAPGQEKDEFKAGPVDNENEDKRKKKKLVLPPHVLGGNKKEEKKEEVKQEETPAEDKKEEKVEEKKEETPKEEVKEEEKKEEAKEEKKEEESKEDKKEEKSEESK